MVDESVFEDFSVDLIGYGFENLGMAKAKNDNRQPFKYVRIKEPAASIAESSAEKRLMKLTAWVTEAVIEKLTKEGLWPPPAELKK